jgi:uncharacterized membrane protein
MTAVLTVSDPEMVAAARVKRRQTVVGPRTCVLLLVAVFTATFSVLAVRQHNRFGTWGFDLGIYDQAFWLVSRGKSFMTMRGLSVWGHHNNAVAFLFAPAYWLGAGPRFLVTAQAAVLGLGAVPVANLVRRRLQSAWAGVAGAAAYLLYAPVEWLSWANFHPEAMAVAPLLFAWWYATERRWRATWLAVVVALCMREEVGLVVGALGLVLLFWARRAEASQRSRIRMHGTAMAVAGAAWFFASSRVLIPAFTGGAEPFYIARYYGNWGSSMTEVLSNVLRHPARVWKQVVDRRSFLIKLFAPTAVLGVFAPSLLMLAVPQALVVLLGSQWFLWDVRFQYTALLIPGVVLATIEGVGRVWKNSAFRRPTVLAFVGATLLGHFMLAPSPLGRESRQWADSGHRAALDAAVALVPPDAPVAATEHVVPHLTGREQVWDLPNPYVALFYGPKGDTRVSLRTANAPDWIVVEAELPPNGTVRKLVRELRRLGTHEVALDQDGVLVLHKTRDLRQRELAQVRRAVPAPSDALRG